MYDKVSVGFGVQIHPLTLMVINSWWVYEEGRGSIRGNERDIIESTPFGVIVGNTVVPQMTTFHLKMFWIAFFFTSVQQNLPLFSVQIYPLMVINSWQMGACM